MSPYKREHGSFFTGVLLIFFGAMFLAWRLYPGLAIGHLLVRYWPLLLIFWGITLLLERNAARKGGEGRGGGIGAGEVLLLIALLVVAAGFVGWDELRHHGAEFGMGTNWMRESAVSSEQLDPQTIPPGSQVEIITPSGDVTVHAGTGDSLRVVAKRLAYGWDEREAQRKVQQINVAVSKDGGVYQLRPSIGSMRVAEARVDLDVELPANVTLTAQTGLGDVSVSDLNGNVSVNNSNGDTDLHDITGNVAVTSHHGDTHITNTKGDVKLDGNGGEVEITDVTGGATIQGEFMGPIRVRNVANTVLFNSSRTDLSIVHLTGHLETDSGSLEIADTTGPVKLTTRDKDVTLENIGGQIDLNARHGDIEVRFSQPPRDAITLTNDSGDISLTLTGKSSFEINATSHSGDVDSDFEGPSLRLVKGDEESRLTGSYGGASGPQIHIETSYGTVSLHKEP